MLSCGLEQDTNVNMAVVPKNYSLYFVIIIALLILLIIQKV